MKHIYFGNGHKYIHKHFIQDAQLSGHNLNHLANSVLKPLMGFKHLSEIFWTFLISSTVGVILAIARMCYKSKCYEIDIGCLKIRRDVEIEEKEDERVLKMGRSQSGEINL